MIKKILFFGVGFFLLSCAVDVSNKTDLTGLWFRSGESVNDESVKEELRIELTDEKMKDAEGKVDKTVILGSFSWTYLVDGKKDSDLSFDGSVQISKTDFTVAFIPSDELITPVICNFILKGFGETLSLVDTTSGEAFVFLKTGVIDR